MTHKKPPIAKTIAPAMIVSVLCLAVVTPHRAIETAAAKTVAEERAERIEAALFTRAEFFGVQAIIPYPTAEARARLAEVRKLYPQDSEIELKLAELDEKLGDEEQARAEMRRYAELEKDNLPALERLANFYRRRAPRPPPRSPRSIGSKRVPSRLNRSSVRNRRIRFSWPKRYASRLKPPPSSTNSQSQSNTGADCRRSCLMRSRTAWNWPARWRPAERTTRR
jgi:hypothetical protein